MSPYLKYNSLTVATYNALLRYRCRNVRAYIFVATTGRSGSESLSKIFEAAGDAVCFHEPYPIMYNDYPKGTDPKRYFEERFKKVKQINIKRSAVGHQYYVETNHQFAKNFLPYAASCFGNKIRIIHLVRNPVQVAISFYSIGSIPGKSEQGKLYLIDPEDEANRIQVADILLSDADYSHDYYKCLWYWYELETRVCEWKRRFARVKWVQIQTDDLNDVEAMRRMFRGLDVDVDEAKLASLVGVRLNSKFEEKEKTIDIDECEAMHKKLLRRMEERYDPNFWC